uniref:Uncharacterized protein n=1 Tax=Panagrolaimus sp. ES5 TaxID=591445 RepID=A0AC34GI57_9BILA
MGKDIASWTQVCMKCFAHRSHVRDRPPLNPISTVMPMEIVGMDIAEMPRINVAVEWADSLPFALFAYNTVPHEATNETPSFLLHGVDPFTPSKIDPEKAPTKYHVDIDEYKHQVLENLYAAQAFVRDTLTNYREQMQKEYNARKRTRETTIRVGDLVYVELPNERAKNALSKLASR